MFLETSRFLRKLCKFKKTQGQIEPMNALVIVKNDNIGDYILFRNFLPFIKQYADEQHQKLILIANAPFANFAKEVDERFFHRVISVDFKKFAKSVLYREQVKVGLGRHLFSNVYHAVYEADKNIEKLFISHLHSVNKIKHTFEGKGRNEIFNVYTQSPQVNLFELDRYKEMVSRLIKKEIFTFNYLPIHRAETLNKSLLKEPYVAFFPGSSAHLKRWSSSRFAEVGKEILAHTDLKLLIVGSKADQKYAHRILNRLTEYQHRIIDLTGKTSLVELSKIIADSSLLVSNDSVSVHMAANANIPAVCVAMGENYGRFIPYPEKYYAKGKYVFHSDVVTLVQNNQHNAFLNLNYDPNINDISVNRVMKSVNKILSSPIRSV